VHFSQLFIAFTFTLFPALHTTSHFTLQLITHPKSWSLTTTQHNLCRLFVCSYIIYNKQSHSRYIFPPLIDRSLNLWRDASISISIYQHPRPCPFPE
jgi:hypothetical protein